MAYRKFDTAREIITSVLEHPSVLEVVRYLEEREGFKVKYVDVTKMAEAAHENVHSLR